MYLGAGTYRIAVGAVQRSRRRRRGRLTTVLAALGGRGRFAHDADTLSGHARPRLETLVRQPAGGRTQTAVHRAVVGCMWRMCVCLSASGGAGCSCWVVCTTLLHSLCVNFVFNHCQISERNPIDWVFTSSSNNRHYHSASRCLRFITKKNTADGEHKVQSETQTIKQKTLFPGKEAPINIDEDGTERFRSQEDYIRHCEA